MDDQPQVSVLMTAYNAMRYVRVAVESVLSQTFGDFEFIIIDDGSTDGTTEVLRSYSARDPRIRLVSRPNTGLGVALNEGLAMARAPLIARMDADDECLPERFEKQVRYLREHEECVLLGSRVLWIDSDGAPLFDMIGIELTHEKIDEQLITAGWSIVHPAVMMRRDVLLAVGGYKPELVPNEDHDLFLRMAEVGKLANLPEVLLKYRQHGHSVSATHGSLRMKTMRAVLDAAWERRKIASREKFPAILPDPPDTHPGLTRKRNWAWMSLNAGNKLTARKYAMAALREAPLSLESWKIAFCVFRA
jgi:glycosyltransferase involved in cell wall biosynthesis